MKFCVMTAAKSNAVLDFQFPLRKQRRAKNMMRLQLLLASTNPAGAIARNDSARPRFAFALVPEVGARLAVHEIGIARPKIALGDDASLRLAAQSRFGTGRTKAVAVLMRREMGAAHATGLSFMRGSGAARSMKKRVPS